MWTDAAISAVLTTEKVKKTGPNRVAHFYKSNFSILFANTKSHKVATPLRWAVNVTAVSTYKATALYNTVYTMVPLVHPPIRHHCPNKQKLTLLAIQRIRKPRCA